MFILYSVLTVNHWYCVFVLSVGVPSMSTMYLYFQSVVPLNEYCGLLEWVNNTLGLRHILIRMYKERGIYYTGKELQSMTPKLEAPLE